DKIIDELEKQRVPPLKSRRRKGFMCYGDQAVNVSKKDVVPRKTRSLTITEETVVSELANSINTYAEWGQKLKGLAVDDPAVQSLLDLQKGSKASRLESLKQKKQTVIGEGSSNAHSKHYADSDTNSDAILYSSCSDTTEESDNKTDDADDSDTDLSDDNPDRDDDATGFVYTDAQTTSAVIYPKANLELTSYISGASEVPLGTHVDVQATNVLLQEMFSDENAHHIPSLPAKKIPYTTTTP
ncbi:hypothetical protein Tco_0590268, partial [Tanacetum coccineum]